MNMFDKGWWTCFESFIGIHPDCATAARAMEVLEDNDVQADEVWELIINKQVGTKSTTFLRKYLKLRPNTNLVVLYKGKIGVYEFFLGEKEGKFCLVETMKEALIFKTKREARRTIRRFAPEEMKRYYTINEL